MKRRNTESVNDFSRRVLLAKLAEQKGCIYDTNTGLRDAKSGNLIGTDLNTVAKSLLGQMTTERDIATTESILNVIVKLTNYEQIVESVRPALKLEGVTLPKSEEIVSHKTGTVEWFRNMIEIVT